MASQSRHPNPPINTARPRQLTPAKSLAERAADEIRTMITNGELPSGEALSELTLAGQLGVSKTPVREALLRLRQEGLVETSPRRGTYVFAMDTSQVTQLSRFRFVLERSALDMLTSDTARALAAEHSLVLEGMAEAIADDDGPRYRMLDTKFHLSIIQSSNNVFLIEAYNGIAWRIQALLSRLLKDPKLNTVSFHEHHELSEKIVTGDISKAIQLLESHILDAEKRYTSIVSENSDLA
jgi:DNA-binding GntR family transcriptional regulator